MALFVQSQADLYGIKSNVQNIQGFINAELSK